MEFSLSFNNFDEELILPVNPSEFSIATGQKSTVIDISQIGEMSQIGGQELAVFDISSFFPKQYGKYCTYVNIPEPYEAVEKILGWKEEKKPIRFIVSGTPINMACSIDKFEYGEQACTRDVNYTLSLKEYRFITVEKTDGHDSAYIQPRPTTKTIPKTYTVRSGDYLFIIAKKITGNADNWRKIYEANKDIIGKDPNLIIPGQELKIVV